MGWGGVGWGGLAWNGLSVTALVLQVERLSGGHVEMHSTTHVYSIHPWSKIPDFYNSVQATLKVTL